MQVNKVLILRRGVITVFISLMNEVVWSVKCQKMVTNVDDIQFYLTEA